MYIISNSHVYVIVNVQIFPNDAKALIPCDAFRSNVISKPMLMSFDTYGPNILVIPESHKICNTKY